MPIAISAFPLSDLLRNMVPKRAILDMKWCNFVFAKLRQVSVTATQR